MNGVLLLWINGLLEKKMGCLLRLQNNSFTNDPSNAVISLANFKRGGAGGYDKRGNTFFILVNRAGAPLLQTEPPRISRRQREGMLRPHRSLYRLVVPATFWYPGVGNCQCVLHTTEGNAFYLHRVRALRERLRKRITPHQRDRSRQRHGTFIMGHY